MLKKPRPRFELESANVLLGFLITATISNDDDDLMKTDLTYNTANVIRLLITSYSVLQYNAHSNGITTEIKEYILLTFLSGYRKLTGLQFGSSDA